MREWVVLAGVLLLLGGMMVYALAREYRRIETSEGERLQTQAQVLDHHVRRQLETVNEALRTVLDAAPDWPTPMARPGETLLRMLVDVMPGVRTLAVMNAQGTVLASNRHELLGRNFRDRDYYRHAVASPRGDMLYVSAPFRSYLGSVAMTAAKVGEAPGGGMALLAVATLDPDYFGSVLGSVNYASDMWAAVLHGQGRAFQVAPLTASDVLNGLDAEGSFWQQHAAGAQSSSLSIDSTDSVRRMVAVRTVQPAPLLIDQPISVVVGRSHDAMYAPMWQQARTYSLLFGGLALACALSLGLLQHRRAQLALLRQTSHAAKRDSEERVALALRGADLGLWEWNLASGRLTLDERGCAMLGLTPAQLQLERQTWRERLHPDDSPGVLALAEAHLQGQTPRFEAEYRVRHADGHWVWLLSRGNRVAPQAGPAPGKSAERLTGTHMDITARKQAADALAAREAELRDFKDMLDETLDGVFILDAETLQFIYVNEGAIRMSGYAESDLLRMGPSDLLWDTTMAQYRERTQPLVEGLRPSQLTEATHRHRDGHAIPVEVFLQYLPATAERRPRFLAVVRDLTARQAQNALKLSEARFRVLIEHAPVAIAILRGDSFDYTNHRFLAMHGYAESDSLAGAPWRAAFADDAHAALANPLVAPSALAGDAAKAHSICKDGRPLPVLVASTTVALSDGPATVAFLQDISALEEAEAELVQARDAAEQASRAKAEFVANMSHEVRTPLNAVLGLAYLLEHSGLADDPLDLVRKIHAAGRTLLGIINHILDISKIEAGRLEMEHAPFRLEEVIDNVATIMGVNAGDKPLELVIDPAPLGAAHLVGDALRLQQVLVNLTGNAIKFTHQGQVSLQVRLQRRDSRQVLLRFAVADTGIGIPPDKIGDIFSPFAQADSSTTRRFGGTGLGLAICRQLVELMGGEIGVRSTPGQGSEFWFTLPFEPAPPAHFSSPAMLQVRALVADDSALVREAAVATARALGWQVDAVDSGRGALDAIVRRAAQHDLPDVVLLDWQMPGMDGLAAARAIRASVAGDTCPIVIMVTASARGRLVEEAGTDLIDGVMDKPLTSSKLYDAVVQAMRRRGTSDNPPPAEHAVPERALAGIRILVVDDSEINREVALRILQSQGASVALAENGQQALETLRDMEPSDIDIVMMDVQMPVLDGIEATRRIREQPRWAQLPVVALTAGAFKSQQEAAWNAGMSGFISKPFDVAHAVALIRRLTGRDGEPAMHVLQEQRPATTLPRTLPGIDVVQGLHIWSDERAYGRYLERFVREHADATEQIVRRLAQGDEVGAAALAHRLRGAAAHMALPEVAELATQAERLLSEGRDATDVLERLRLAQQTASDSIAQLLANGLIAPAPSTSAPLSRQGPLDEETEALLSALLVALDQDDPAPAEPLLSALSPRLARDEHEMLQRLLDDYDFRTAEDRVRRLIGAAHGAA